MLIEEGRSTLSSVFIANRSKLRRAALGIVCSPEVADDVIQDAYLKLAGATVARVVGHPLGYCFQVVRNMALDHCRKASLELSLFREESEGMNVPSSGGGPERQVIGWQSVEIIDRTLSGLPARTRQAFELYRIDGLTQRTISMQMGLSLGLVNALIRDALLVLMGCRACIDAA